MKVFTWPQLRGFAWPTRRDEERARTRQLLVFQERLELAQSLKHADAEPAYRL